MKKKVLFYGNCQAGVLGEWLNNNYSDKFEVIDCKECGLEGFWGTKNFAPWSPENSPKQQNFYKCIQSKIKECDVFIFTHIEGLIDELNTQNLCSTVAADKLNICIPNVRFRAYPTEKITLAPFAEYIYNTISKDRDIIFNYLLNENDPKFEEIIKQQFEVGTTENILRYHHISNIYQNTLEINNFIENNWKKHLLFGSHNHPIGIYWTELIKKLLEKLDISFDTEKVKDIRYPNKDGIIDPNSFSFFTNLFPNIIIHNEIKKLHKPTIENLF